MLLICVVFSRGSGLSGELQSSKSFLSAYNVGYLTVAEGLPHNFVDDIYRDSRGFLWIALGGGAFHATTEMNSSILILHPKIILFRAIFR